MMFFRYC